jgi:hypothetical protein
MMVSPRSDTAEAPVASSERSDRLGVTLSAVRRRLGILRWVVPAAMFMLVVLYEAGPARWILNTYGPSYHLAAELAVYGLLGPVAAAILLDLLGRWIEERETTELQARALAQARAHAEQTHRLTDDILQTMFAVSTLIGSFEDRAEELPNGAAEQLRSTHRALDDAIQRLYTRLKDN